MGRKMKKTKGRMPGGRLCRGVNAANLLNLLDLRSPGSHSGSVAQVHLAVSSTAMCKRGHLDPGPTPFAQLIETGKMSKCILASPALLARLRQAPAELSRTELPSRKLWVYLRWSLAEAPWVLLPELVGLVAIGVLQEPHLTR